MARTGIGLPSLVILPLTMCVGSPLPVHPVSIARMVADATLDRRRDRRLAIGINRLLKRISVRIALARGAEGGETGEVDAVGEKTHGAVAEEHVKAAIMR